MSVIGLLLRGGLIVLFLIGILGVGQVNQALGQATGPLAQFQQNVHQLHIVARYFGAVSGTRYQANVIQTVTGVALKSTSQATFWLIEPEHVDSEFFYRERNVPRGTPIQFFYFVDVINIQTLVSASPGTPVLIIQRTENYVVMKETLGRSIPELALAAQVSAGEPVVAALLNQQGLTDPGRFQERAAKITEVQDKLFFIDQDLGSIVKNDGLHGAPIFVQHDGSWKLAGIFVDHGRSSRPNQSAVARLPELEQLIPKEAEKPDRDKDGVPDDQDRCPNIPGDPENQGCL
ncbi:MAG: hypothetical protein A2Z21_03230 [Candidatus Fraserbacteria bacterium RBG_16_55_9]|uniref:Uncharacterized protein n=1 Tax=Fraserbacteria sp. (strain RBG_16_55_9) TaxID=1817864 RepID=A0A1F5V1I9_FRAXR|nr:MAG: hypothetical protein A2Z21_03230 [Candidatus Fraserbacteria bacterium RBG_16_55_9]